MEIERKFMMAGLPENLESYKKIDIEQGYISTQPVIRIRKKCSDEKSAYVLTMKSSGMLSREEYEMNVTEDEYMNLAGKVEGNLISKTRYIIPIDGRTLEMDIFHGDFDGLIMGEIEFPDEEAATAYVPNEIFSEEVTYDKHFHNSTMSSMSKSEIKEFIDGLRGMKPQPEK